MTMEQFNKLQAEFQRNNEEFISAMRDLVRSLPEKITDPTDMSPEQAILDEVQI